MNDCAGASVSMCVGHAEEDTSVHERWVYHRIRFFARRVASQFTGSRTLFYFSLLLLCLQICISLPFLCTSFFPLFWFFCFLLLICFTTFFKHFLFFFVVYLCMPLSLSLSFSFFFFYIHDDLILRLNVLPASEFVYYWKAQADVVNLLKDLKRYCTILVVSHDLRNWRYRRHGW